MTQRRRIEVTFSKKDDVLWEFVNRGEDSPTVFIKKLLRKRMEEELEPEFGEKEEPKDEVIEEKEEPKQEEITPESNPLPINTGFTF